MEFPSAVSWHRLSDHKADGWRDVPSLSLCQGTSTRAGGDSPQPHTVSEQTQEELAGDTASEHHLQPPSLGLSALQKCQTLHTLPHRRAGLHQPQPLVTPKVSFWETAGLVPGCLTPSDLLLQPHLQAEWYPKCYKPLQPKLIPV